jgi:Cu2+-exporting ATPase
MVTAGAVIAMVEGGEWMRDATAARSRRALGELIADRNALVWKVVGEHLVEVRVSELQAGDMVTVAPGDQIPVDGVVHRGTAAVDERFMTGEPVPVRRSVGDRVYAMTVVGEGELTILADSDVQHSRAGRIVEFLEQAPIGDTRMSDQVRRIGDRFVLPVLGLGGVILAATGSPSRTASVITFDLVTGIRVSAPTTMLASLTAAARRGTLIKGAAALESLAQIDAIVFDKTGTLTAGAPSVVAVNSFCELSHDDLLRIAASADQSIRHPLATALCAEAQVRGIKTTALLQRDYQIGFGMEAQLADGHRYLVGNRLLMQQHGVQLAQLPAELHSYADTSRVWIAESPRCLGVVLMRDLQRPEASAAVADLRARGVRHFMLLSGDSEGAARGIAESLGLDEWQARATPEGKAEVVQESQKKGLRVAVVGDGINDSLAFSMADVGIAMGGGSDIASSTAQVVLIDDDLSLLPRAIDGARQAVRLMRQNLALIAVPNLVGLIFALLVPMSPAVAGLLSNGSTILAATNGLRPLNGATATKPAAASSTSRG